MFAPFWGGVHRLPPHPAMIKLGSSIECRFCPLSVLDIETKIHFEHQERTVCFCEEFSFSGENEYELRVSYFFVSHIYSVTLRCNFQPPAFTVHFQDATADWFKIPTTFCAIQSFYRRTGPVCSQIHEKSLLTSKIGIPKWVPELCFFKYLSLA